MSETKIETRSETNEVFATERLIVRRFVETDADAIFALRSNPEFMRYIKKTESRKQAAAWMRMVSRYWETDNYGFWAVVLQETNAVIGWSGTWVLHETGEPEIGFAIAPQYQGCGMATEAANVALRYSFENRRARKVIALAFPENAASRRVMEKLGMRFQHQIFYRSYNLELVSYAITEKEYV